MCTYIISTYSNGAVTTCPVLATNPLNNVPCVSAEKMSQIGTCSFTFVELFLADASSVLLCIEILPPFIATSTSISAVEPNDISQTIDVISGKMISHVRPTMEKRKNLGTKLTTLRRAAVMNGINPTKLGVESA
jgi:hypothetical protein